MLDPRCRGGRAGRLCGCNGRGPLDPLIRLKVPLLEPQATRKLCVVAANVFDEPLRVLAADEHLKYERLAGNRVRGP
jgi:hypothetical protein